MNSPSHEDEGSPLAGPPTAAGLPAHAEPSLEPDDDPDIPAGAADRPHTRVVIVSNDELPVYPEEDWTDDEVHDYFERVMGPWEE